MEIVSNVVIEAIEEKLEALNSHITVNELVEENISDYKRGVIAGQIIGLQSVLDEVAGKLISKEDKDEESQSKNSVL